MEFLEKNLEDLIFESDRNSLKDRGLTLQGKVKRQLRIGNYGIADLVTLHREVDYSIEYGDEIVNGECVLERKKRTKPVITIYELKKDKIGISAFLQAIGYIKGIQEYIDKRSNKLFFLSEHTEYRIVLIGKEIDTKSTYCYLESFLPYHMLKNYTYKYGINGLNFTKESGFYLKDNGLGL